MMSGSARQIVGRIGSGDEVSDGVQELRVAAYRLGPQLHTAETDCATNLTATSHDGGWVEENTLWVETDHSARDLSVSYIRTVGRGLSEHVGALNACGAYM